MRLEFRTCAFKNAVPKTPARFWFQNSVSRTARVIDSIHNRGFYSEPVLEPAVERKSVDTLDALHYCLVLLVVVLTPFLYGQSTKDPELSDSGLVF